MQTGLCPRVRADLSVREIDGETVVLDRRGLKVHQFNATASRVWELCDGERTEAEIADAVAEAFEVDPERAVRDVAVVVGQFRELGLLAQE
jgi:hypothetical protein